MVGQRRAPGVQHGGEADAGAEMLRVGGDGGQRLGGGPEQEVVDRGLVLERDGADRGRQSEDDVIVGNREQLRLAVFKPLPRRGGLALRAVAVAAGIVGDPFVRAVLAALDVSAERGRATGLDRRHHFQLGEARVPGVGLPPRRPMGAKDEPHDLETGLTSRVVLTSASAPPARHPYRASGLVVCRACSVAWRRKSSTQPDGGEGLAMRKGYRPEAGSEGSAEQMCELMDKNRI